MNIQEYIESGILEAYILGSLTPDEVTLVEANIALFPELALETLAIESAMEQYAATLSTEPPVGLQDKIWTMLTHAPSEGSVEDAKENGTSVKGRIISLHPEAPVKKNEWRYAAALIVLTGSILLNLLFWYHGKKQNDITMAMSGRLDTFQQQQGRLSQTIGNYQKEKEMMADTAMQTIVLRSVQAGHPMAATVYWSKREGLAYVAADALPAPPKGMQYQLWVMQNGKPVDMGVIANDMASTPLMQKVARSVTNGQAFAISLEREGGSPTPTMQNIYVMGTAS